jgi:catechol 2,3-dioxygenase-like lactoylglutathione lyase family enzyme
MSQMVSSFKEQKYDAGVARVDMKFEVSLIPVSDVDRAKEFYTRLGWRLDDDLVVGDDFRVVQITPPGFRELDFIRQGSYVGRAWLVQGWADRLRH